MLPLSKSMPKERWYKSVSYCCQDDISNFEQNISFILSNLLYLNNVKTTTMKPTLFSLILILFSSISTQSKAQEYQPIAKEGSHWIIKKDLITTIDPVDEIWEYFAHGDTLINDIIYKKIFNRNLVTTQDGPPYEADGLYFLDFLMRDDIENKKVYAIGLNTALCNPDGESIIYDFSLQMNDTAKFCIYPEELIGIVYDIENVSIFDTPTKQMRFQNIFLEFDYAYEGIGSNYGLIENMSTPYKKNNKYTEMTWLSDYCIGNDCDIFVGISDETRAQIKAFPNPASEIIYFETPDIAKNAQILILDNLGRLVKEHTINNKITSIITSSFSKGIYSYQIISNEDIYSGQFIVK